MAEWHWWQIAIGILRRWWAGKSKTIDQLGQAGADAGLWPERKQGPAHLGPTGLPYFDSDISQHGPGGKGR